MESKQGPEHPSTLRVRGNLAVAFRADGRIAKAIALHEKNLKFSESIHGPDHPYTLQIRNNLASAYRDAGKTAEAVAMQEANLKAGDSDRSRAPRYAPYSAPTSPPSTCSLGGCPTGSRSGGDTQT